MATGLRGAVEGYARKSSEVADSLKRTAASIDNLQPPKVTPLPKMPETTPTDFATMFGSAAFSLAGLGSLMTRHPMTTALNAGKAVMDAYRENDTQRAQQAFQLWKIQTDNALTLHKLEQDAYHNSLEKLKAQPEIAKAEITALAASFKDEVALAMLNRGDTDGAVAMITGRGRLGTKMGVAQLQLRDEIEKRNDRARVEAMPPGPERDAAATEMHHKWLERAKLDDEMGAAKLDQAKPVNATIEMPDGTHKPMAVLRAANGAYTDMAGQPLPGKLVQMGTEKPEKALTTAQQTAKAARAAADEKIAAENTRREAAGEPPMTKAEELQAQAQAAVTADVALLKAKADAKPRSAAGTKEDDSEILAASKFEAVYGHPPSEAEKKSDKMANLRTEARLLSGGAISEADAEYVAGRVLAGDERATVGLARSAINISRVTSAIRELGDKYGISPAEVANRVAAFEGVKAAQRAIGTRLAGIEVPAAELEYMAPIAINALKAVNPTEYPDLNKIINDAKQRIGGPEVVSLGLAVDALATIYARFKTPSNVSTDAEKTNARRLMSAAYSSGQLDAAISTMLQEVKAGEQGALKTREKFLGPLGAPQLGSAMQGPSGAAPATTTPPPDAVAHLKANPELASQFDEMFGPGAARKVLGR